MKYFDLIEQMSKALNPLKPYGGMLSLTAEMSRALNPLKPYGGMLSLTAEMSRALNPLKPYGGMLSLTAEISKTLGRSPFHGKSIFFEESRKTANFFRTFGLPELAAANRRSLGLPTEILQDVNLVRKIGLSSPFSNTNDPTRHLRRHLTSLHNLSNVGSMIAAVGLAGRFDRTLVNAAVTAAELIHRHGDKEESIGKLREQSVLVDLVADIQLLIQESSSEDLEESVKQGEVAGNSLRSKIFNHQNSATAFSRAPFIKEFLLFFITVAQLTYAHLSYELDKKSYELAQRTSNDNDSLRIQIEKIQNGLQQLTAAMSETAEAETPYLVVEHPTFLRSRKSLRSAKITRLYPNQKLATVRIDRKWVYVEYYDYRANIPRLGWVLKKHSRRVDGSRPQRNHVRPAE